MNTRWAKTLPPGQGRQSRGMKLWVWGQAAPAIYRAKRPHRVHFNVTWDFGGGGERTGSRSIGPEHDGQLSGDPFRSLAIRCSAWAGLYVFGRGFRMVPPKEVHVTMVKSNRLRPAITVT
jgi:hypothetical protein